MLPLYKNISRDSFTQTYTAHTGLLFDKFPDGWDQSKNYKPADDAKKQFLQEVIDKYQATEALLKTNLELALKRQCQLVALLGGDAITASTDWRLVSGLGAAHPYETGFIWHRTLSVPYLPGSSIKGMMRAWATDWLEPPNQLDINRINQLFGAENDCGALIVFDALPCKPPELQLDILNPHYSEYYQDPKNPPADYLSPVPVFFLTVAPGQRFEFSLAPRLGASKQPQQDLEDGLELLKGALETLGAGGKTAVGYGFFNETIESQQRREDTKNANKRAEDKAAKEAKTKKQAEEKGITGLAEQIYSTAQLENWETCESNPQFYQTMLDYIRQIDTEPNQKIQQDAISIVKDIVEKKYPGIMQDPERTEGKKNKLAYKPKPIEIAQKLLAIINKQGE